MGHVLNFSLVIHLSLRMYFFVIEYIAYVHSIAFFCQDRHTGGYPYKTCKVCNLQKYIHCMSHIVCAFSLQCIIAALLTV